MRDLRERQAGYALVAVLWTAALLSLIAASMIAQSRIAIRVERNEWDRLEMRMLADAATNRAILTLMSKGGGDPAFLSGAPTHYKIAGRSVETAIQDETGKADINEVDRPTLESLLKSAGSSPERTARVAADIIAWREPQDERSDESVGPRRFRRFQSVDELRLVPGIDDALFETLRPGITVYSQTGSINPEVAPEFVLRAFLPDETARIDAILAARSLAADVAAVNVRLQSGAAAMLNGRAYAVRTTIQYRGRSRTFETVVRVSGDPKRPYWVLNRSGL